MVETVELSSSSFLDHGAAKKAKLQFDVEDVLDQGDLESPSALHSVPVDDLMIDWGSVCGICYRLVFYGVLRSLAIMISQVKHPHLLILFVF